MGNMECWNNTPDRGGLRPDANALETSKLEKQKQAYLALMPEASDPEVIRLYGEQVALISKKLDFYRGQGCDIGQQSLSQPESYVSRERERGYEPPFQIISGKDHSYTFKNARYEQRRENVWKYELYFEKEVRKYLKMPETRTFTVVFHPEKNTAEIISYNGRSFWKLPLHSHRFAAPISVNIDGMELLIQMR